MARIKGQASFIKWIPLLLDALRAVGGSAKSREASDWIADEWVLFVSPYGKVQHFVGDFDADTCHFRPRTRGLLDHGPNFYAPNTMLLPDVRRLMRGWVSLRLRMP